MMVQDVSRKRAGDWCGGPIMMAVGMTSDVSKPNLSQTCLTTTTTTTTKRRRQRLRRKTSSQITMLPALPPELTLDTISRVHICDIPVLRLVHSSWKAFVDVHENVIYRSAAILHALASYNSSIEDARGDHILPWLDEVVDWKLFCGFES